MNNELYHYGVLGMKWGVRKKKYQNDISKRKTKKRSVRQENDRIVKDKKNSGRKWKTSAGYDISLEPELTPKTEQFLSRCSRTIRNNIKDSSTLTISSKGKKIGDLQLYDNRKDNSVNLAWMGIDQSAEGKSYAQSVMNNIVKNAERNGKSKVTLEVPGRSPDSRHIYEKIGFKPTQEVLGEKDNYLDGITVMELDLDDRRRMKHSEVGRTNNELCHYGIKGMKWGVRRKRQSKSSKNNKFKKKTEEVHDDYKRAHSNKSVKSMSDNELRSRINRLQMEQNYSKLKGQKVSKGKKIFDKMNKTLTTAAAITGTGLTLYNNASRIKKVLEENGVFSNTVENAKKKTAKKTMRKAAKRASRVYGLLPYNK